MLEIAEAFAALPEKPARSILFLAVTAEEQGLLGAKYYAENPLYPLAKTVANINMDEANNGAAPRTSSSSVAATPRLVGCSRGAAATQQRTVEADPEPEKGFFYRSDQFEFAKQGVPALYTSTGVRIVGKEPGYGLRMRAEYDEGAYHGVDDEVKSDWDLTGAAEDAALLFQSATASPNTPPSRNGASATSSKPAVIRCSPRHPPNPDRSSPLPPERPYGSVRGNCWATGAASVGPR
jgi:Zn-dependent M28 family amino/carboxypeptidase